MRWTGARTRAYWRFSCASPNASERLASRGNPRSAATDLARQRCELAAARIDTR
jgi:hypothetical protein